MLTDDGHEVVSCETAEAALQMIGDPRAQVDVLITAVEFAAMSGLELCWEARLAVAENPMHIIVLSSSRDENKLAEALDAGADDFILKPPRRSELLARLRAASRLLVAQRDLLHLANFDALTGLRNRRSFFEAMGRCEGGPVSVAIFDVDHFKLVNDRHGHDAGDEVLKEVGRRMAAIDRHVARLGGEEFALLVQGPLDEAGAIAERMRRAMEDAPFLTGAGELQVTASIGVAESPTGRDIAQALKRADVALYASKTGGRNRVTLARSPETTDLALAQVIPLRPEGNRLREAAQRLPCPA